MATSTQISIVVPVYNESAGLLNFHKGLVETLENIGRPYEVIYVDDGSQDRTIELVDMWHKEHSRIKLVRLARNFGKEYALTAGLSVAKGAAIITIDGDGQHPVNLIPALIEKWEAGNDVVVGVRKDELSHAKGLKLWGDRLFYSLFNSLNDRKLVKGETDFRLIDREVCRAFLQLPETNRLTRSLIDWLGFERSYVYFTVQDRQSGQPTYTKRKLFALATDGLVSMSPKPLFACGIIGLLVTGFAFLIGLVVFLEQILFADPLHWNFTGTALLGILILFLVGILLTAQGVVALYISHIHSQSQNRPLFVIDYKRSVGISVDEA